MHGYIWICFPASRLSRMELVQLEVLLFIIDEVYFIESNGNGSVNPSLVNTR